MNYFEFYNIPISLNVDKVALKKNFYANSRKYHPDFYATSSAEKQAEILELSSLNNEAYKTLSDFDKRVKYVLELKNILAEEGKNTIPQEFLMDMMEINEALMELEFDFDQDSYKNIQQQLEQKETELYRTIEPVVHNFQEDQLELVRAYYLKKKYLLRIRENIAKFTVL